jgi:hypothetical protein
LYGGESVQNIVQVSESVRHVTTALNRLRLADLSKNNNNLTDVRIIDSWGVTAQNYNEVFLNLIKGMLPPKYKMVKNENIQQDLVTVDMLPQCVLFCITAADLESKSDFCQIIQRYINICVSSDIAPMLLITKIDESPSISKIQRSNLTVSNAPVKPLIDQARSLFGLNENLIIPLSTTEMSLERVLKLIGGYLELLILPLISQNLELSSNPPIPMKEFIHNNNNNNNNNKLHNNDNNDHNNIDTYSSSASE